MVQITRRVRLPIENAVAGVQALEQFLLCFGGEAEEAAVRVQFGCFVEAPVVALENDTAPVIDARETDSDFSRH